MDKIPLRTYLKEIENQIDRGENDQAIAHCRHILKSYPKNLATYRLLGKAYLECRRYGDAADVFQRVLSGAPDDFVSHVGMSIIREDESNQDAAIWHMERAFEIQPYNSAIQDELRRLYGRRDGLEPPKVRLTRGALARMYARGNLYQQAIGELRAALAEDPKRSDLQVLLARMYFLAGQKVEAVETCSTLLKKLPYCLEANRIISAILPETERKEETQVYRERVMSLDPYLVLASPYELSSDGVRDQVVMVEKLDYQEGEFEEAAQPAWAASLGVTFDEFKSGDEPVPDWLQAISDGHTPAGPAIPAKTESEDQLSKDVPIQDSTPAFSGAPELIPGKEEDELPSWISFPDQPSGKAAPTASGEIPEWMKEAGWESPTGTVESNLPDFEYPEAEEISEAEIEMGELPTWLQSLAPVESNEGEPLSGDDALLSSMPWLSETGGGSEQVDQESPVESEWLEEVEAAGEETSAEPPDWLKELDEAEPAIVEGEAALDAGLWAGSEAGEPPELEAVSAESLTSEVLEEEIAQTQPDQESSPVEAVEGTFAQAFITEDEVPEWLKEGVSETEEVTAELSDLDSTALPEAPDQSTGLTSEELITEAAGEDEKIPDWLKEVDGETVEEQLYAPQAGLGGEAMVEEEEGTEAPETELPESEMSFEDQDLQEELTGEPGTLEPSPEEVSEAAPQDISETVEEGELPDWLKELGAEPLEPESLEGEAEGVVEAVQSDEIPEWMRDIASEVTETQIEGVEAEEGEGFDTSEDIPDWLREFGQEEAEVVLDDIKMDDLELADEQEQLESAQTEEIPAWLREVDEEDLEQAQVDVDLLPEAEAATGLEAAEIDVEEQDWLQIIGEKPLRAEPDLEDQIPSIPEYSPEELESLLADTQPLRIAREEPAVPFNEILEEIDSTVVSQEAGEYAEESTGEVEAVPGELVDEFEGLTPGFFGAALEAADLEEPSPGEGAVQGELEPVLPAEEASPIQPFEMEDQDAGMAWLESLAAKHGVSEEELFTSPSERPETYPFVGEVEELVAEEPVAEPEPEEFELEASEDGLLVTEEAGQVEKPGEEELVWTEESVQAEGELAEAVDMPDWLEELDAVEQGEPESDAEEISPVQAPAGETPFEEMVDEEIPEWLREMQSEAEAELLTQEPAVSEPAEAALEDSDAALAWLEGLAAKQGVPEEQLFTAPDERVDVPPSWVEQGAEAVAAGEISQPAEPEVVEALEEAEGEQEEGIEVPEFVEEAPEIEPAPPEAEEIPQAAAVFDVVSEEPAPAEEPELPDWLAQPEEAQADEVEWEIPLEPVKAALREPRPGTAPLAVAPSEPVDINKAALVDLETLPGVGFILAQNILTYRDAFGPYQDIEELVKVPGITPAILSEIREYLTVPPVQEAQKPVEPELVDEAQSSLLVARNKLAAGDIGGTIAEYSNLVKNHELLPEIIRDLKEALYRFPVDIGLWQTLGDAYMRNDQLAEALEAYTKAEELLR